MKKLLLTLKLLGIAAMCHAPLSQAQVLPVREQARIINENLAERFEHLLPEMMAQTGIDCGTLRFRITGHTDGTSLELGTDGLDQDRASAVADYLEAKGVARERLYTAAAGSSQPAGDNSTVAGQARNRRIEVTVLP